jgi:hypothetical protein
MSVFYDHLLGLDEIHKAILDLDLPTKQHYHLLKIADSTLHHEVLNVILIEIPQAVHEHFLVAFHDRPHDSNHFEYIKQFSPEIEDKIQAASSETRERILAEFSGT